jgi:hypothetical protein
VFSFFKLFGFKKMDLVIYLDKQVYITLSGDFYYVGHCIDADGDSITIIDKRQNRVTLSKNSILTIREVGF